MYVQGKSAALVAITATLTLAAGIFAVQSYPQARPQSVDTKIVAQSDLSEIQALKSARSPHVVVRDVEPKKLVITSKTVVKRASRSRTVVQAPVVRKEQASVSRGTYKDYALSLVGAAQFQCLEPLWEHESSWRTDASNPNGTAWGIPQALPGSKMASEGADWRTNGRTQIRWGVKYIAERYGNSCNAWAHFQSHNWY